MKLDKYKVDKIIYEYVKRNYGEREAHNPKWSIVEIANEIVDKYGEI